MRTRAGVLAALMLLAGGTASAAQPDNLAFADATLTQAAIDHTTAALAAVLTYDYRKLDDTTASARQHGTDQYVTQHTKQLGELRTTATRQRQQVTTKVAGVGVRELRAESARLLAFVDQTTTRGDTGKTATAGLSVMVDLRLVGGQWRLDTVQSVGS